MAPDQAATGLGTRWSALDDVMILSDGARITWASPSVTTVLGYAAEDLVGTSVYDLVHRDEFEVIVSSRGHLHETGTARIRIRIRHRSGEWRWIDARISILPTDDLDPTSRRVLAFWRDVTDEGSDPARRGDEIARDDVRGRLRPDGTISWIQRTVTASCGYVPADLLGIPFAALVHPDDRRRAFDALRSFTPDDHPPLVVRLQSAAGDWLPAVVTLEPDSDPRRPGITMRWRFGAGGDEDGLDAPVLDATPSVRLADHVADVLLHHRLGRIMGASASVTRALGWLPAELAGRAIDDLVHPDDLAARREATAAGDPWKARHRALATDGTWHWVETHACAIGDDRASGTVESWRVIDDQVAIERELIQRATHDGLTGLLNRTTILDRLAHLLDPRQSDDVAVALVFIDVDDFKGVNDRYGHATGDDILVRLAHTVRSFVRQDDLVGRLGGDEILVVLRSIDDVDLAANVAIKILAAARSMSRAPHGAAAPTLSVGVTLARPPETPADALARADRAMYQAKRAGGDHVVARAEHT